VVEEYLRAGEDSARLFQRAVAGATGNGDSDLVSRMVRAGSDMMTFWLELMARSAGSVARPSGSGAATVSPASVTPPDREPWTGDAARVSIEVASHRPAVVSLDLRGLDARSRLHADRLHARDTGGPPLTGVEFELLPDDGRVVVRVRIDPGQPVGHYDGVIVDDVSSLPCGTISVEVRAAQAPSTGRPRSFHPARPPRRRTGRVRRPGSA
jgi:hypothetical protein